MGLIFVMSSDLGSAAHTSRILRPMILWMDPKASPEEIERIQFLVRKAAHLTEYAILALLILRAARAPGRRIAGHWSWQGAGLALLLSAAYAATDEWHQAFVPSRTADLGDVLIDSSGALLGLAAVFLWRRIASGRLVSKDAPPVSG
jgi:VanZ family protein